MSPPVHHSHQIHMESEENPSEILEHIDRVHEEIREYLMKSGGVHHREETTWMGASRFFYGDYNHVSEAKVITLSCLVMMILLVLSLTAVVIVCIVKHRKRVHCVGYCKGYDRHIDEKVHPVVISPDQHPKAQEALANESHTVITVVPLTETGSDVTQEVREPADSNSNHGTPPPDY